MFRENSQNSQENTCETPTLLKKTVAQVFSGEFCEISTNNFFTEHLRATASGIYQKCLSVVILKRQYI